MKIKYKRMVFSHRGSKPYHYWREVSKLCDGLCQEVIEYSNGDLASLTIYHNKIAFNDFGVLMDLIDGYERQHLRDFKLATLL